MHQLHVISTGRQTTGQLIEIVHAIVPYIDAFHLREKQLSARALYNLGENLLLHTGLAPQKLTLNDRLDVALALGAGGVHLAGHSLPPNCVRRCAPGMRVGVSVHSLEEAQAAEVAGADYVLFGHIFSSGSKPGLAPRGTAALQAVSQALSIPVIALGGITSSVLPSVIQTDAGGAAVLSAVMDACHPAEAARQLHTILKQGVNEYENI